MNSTILQVPLSKQLRMQATQVAESQGFSSLQEAVRIFLTQLANQTTQVSFQPVVQLSKKNKKRYAKITEDIKKSKNISPALKNADEVMDFLNSDGKLKK